MQEVLGDLDDGNRARLGIPTDSATSVRAPSGTSADSQGLELSGSSRTVRGRSRRSQ